uniref:Uncharacterized protein n=1 Tax=Micrurus lemniscatus lemniscatus TaxID=129467 RepID=A0A2D4IWP2_MICLE
MGVCQSHCGLIMLTQPSWRRSWFMGVNINGRWEAFGFGKENYSTVSSFLQTFKPETGKLPGPITRKGLDLLGQHERQKGSSSPILPLFLTEGLYRLFSTYDSSFSDST